MLDEESKDSESEKTKSDKSNATAEKSKDKSDNTATELPVSGGSKSINNDLPVISETSEEPEEPEGSDAIPDGHGGFRRMAG